MRRIALALLALLAGGAASAQTVGPGEGLSILGGTRTPLTTIQRGGASAYSYLLTGSGYAGSGGTGMFFGLGHNSSGDKELLVGDFDNLNTTNSCIDLSANNATIYGVNCRDGVTAKQITIGISSAITSLSFYPHFVVNGAGGTLYENIPANNTLHLGLEDGATATAQTFGVNGVIAGTSNVAGANFTIAGSQGTGTGAGGSIIMQVAPAAAGSATTQNALVTGLTIADNGAQGVVTSIAASATNDNGATGNVGQRLSVACPILAGQTATFSNGSANIVLATTAIPVGCPVNFTTSSALPTNFAISTPYYVVSLATLTVTVSATVGGSAIVAGSAGTGTQTAVGSAFLTSNTATDVLGLSLTAGNWVCLGNQVVTPASTMTILARSLNTSKAVLATALSYQAMAASLTTGAVEATSMSDFFALSATTTIHMVNKDTFASTAQGSGTLTCYRPR